MQVNGMFSIDGTSFPAYWMRHQINDSYKSTIGYKPCQSIDPSKATGEITTTYSNIYRYYRYNQ